MGFSVDLLVVTREWRHETKMEIAGDHIEVPIWIRFLHSLLTASKVSFPAPTLYRKTYDERASAALVKLGDTFSQCCRIQWAGGYLSMT